MNITAHSRLHFGLIDMNGSNGRMDGGVGITLSNPKLILKMEESNCGINVYFNSNISNELKDVCIDKIKDSATSTLKYLKSNDSFNFIIENTFPAHHGLGFGTQLSLSVAKLIFKYYDINVNSYTLGQIVGRGGASGIGVHAFEAGGFLVDAGHASNKKLEFAPSSMSNTNPPELLVRYDFPEEWDIILIIPEFDKNIFGKKELDIFQKYTPVPIEDVYKLSYLVLMKLMPAIVEKNLTNFSEGLNNMQNLGFKKVEYDLQNPLIYKCIKDLLDSGAENMGMSSFGPTLFTVTENNTKSILKSANDWVNVHGGRVILTNSQNHGACVTNSEK